jgi:hypothetical protein
MKIIIQLTAVLFLANTASAQNSAVNALIGDISYVRKFQQKPDEHTSEVLRIQTHLSYVEELLREKATYHLNKKQKNKRAAVLDLLNKYWTTGIFPKNYNFEGTRRPCFIDRDGNICAVGYLVEKTAGRKVAEQINKTHQYDYLLDMNEEVIENWANEHGLTLQECAMIQPSYGYLPTDQTFNVPIKTGYGIASGFAGGINLGINLINLRSLNFSRSKTFSYIGLISGTSQIVLGLTNVRKDDKEYQINGPSRTISYKSQNNLSYINIAAGTTTVLTSAVNLFVNRQIKDKRNALNLYSYPDINNKMVAGIAFTRSL